jgi:hypothetical protein
MAATTRAVDLTDVKEGGSGFRPKRKPAGDYKAKIVKVDDHLKEGNEPGWVFTIQVDGDARASYPYYVNPAPKQKWKIGAICRAVGISAAGKRVNFNPNKLVGKVLGIALDDDEYEGRLKSTVDDVFPVSEVGPNASDGSPDAEEYEDVDTDADEVHIPDDEEIEEEEEPPAPPVRKRRPKPAPEPEPEEEEEEEEEAPAPPPRKRTARKPVPAPVVEEEDEEEEEPAPAPVRRRKATPPAKKAPAPVEDDDDLDEIEIDDLDD